MSTERDELAHILSEWLDDEAPLHLRLYKTAADHLMRLGYRKPRTITTAEELDALPVGAIIHGRMLAQKWAEPEGEVWHVAGKGLPWSLTQMVKFGTLPATVLWEPK